MTTTKLVGERTHVLSPTFYMKDLHMSKTAIGARESALVDAQCLIQKALNETYGNPRDHEETDPDKTKHLFEQQYSKLAEHMGRSKFFVDRMLSDHSKLTIKDFAEALHVLGYELKLDITKVS